MRRFELFAHGFLVPDSGDVVVEEVRGSVDEDTRDNLPQQWQFLTCVLGGHIKSCGHPPDLPEKAHHYPD